MQEPSEKDVLEAVDEFLEQGICSGAWEGLGGTGSNRSAIEEATILRAHLGKLLQGYIPVRARL
jgi:hypothetical protein